MSKSGNHARQLGLTLVELLASLAIIGLIASQALPLWSLQQERQNERELRLALREIRTAIDAYKEAYDEGRIEREYDLMATLVASKN